MFLETPALAEKFRMRRRRARNFGGRGFPLTAIKFFRRGHSRRFRTRFGIVCLRLVHRKTTLVKRISPFLSLSSRDYRLFLLGFFISQMVAQMEVVAISWQLYEMTRSAVVLGAVGIASFLPLLLLSTVGGLAADHLDRKKLLLGTQAFLALVALFLAAATIFQIISPWMIFAMVLLNFSAMALFGPVRHSVIPDLVPRNHLLNAVSLNTMTRQTAVIIGPAAAGFLIAFYGVQSVYVLNFLALVVMMATVVPLRIPSHHEALRSPFTFAAILEGIRFVKNSKIIFSTVLLDFFAQFFGSATSLLPIFATEILALDARGLGLLYAATSVGAVVAGIVLSASRTIHHQGHVIIGSVVVYGLATIGFGLSHSYYLTLAFLAIAGAGDMVSTILRNNIRQLITPSHIRGRMMGINMVFAQGGPKLGDAEAGFIAAATSAPFSVVVGGIGTLVATAAIACAMPALRKFKGDHLEI